MPVYMVERDLPGVTGAELTAAQRAAIEIPFTRIVEAFDLTP